MKQRESEQVWQSFLDTGELGAYLLYAAVKHAEAKKGNED